MEPSLLDPNQDNLIHGYSDCRKATDGDLLIQGSRDASATELALRSLIGRLNLSNEQIRNALERGDEAEFERTALYLRTMALADAVPPGRPVPRALVPRMALKSPKIRRDLTTDWFARRVDERYKRCLARAGHSDGSTVGDRH